MMRAASGGDVRARLAGARRMTRTRWTGQRSSRSRPTTTRSIRSATTRTRRRRSGSSFHDPRTRSSAVGSTTRCCSTRASATAARGCGTGRRRARSTRCSERDLPLPDLDAMDLRDVELPNGNHLEMLEPLHEVPGAPFRSREVRSRSPASRAATAALAPARRGAVLARPPLRPVHARHRPDRAQR